MSVADCPPAEGLGPDQSSATILIVEDEVLIRMMLAQELRDAGFTILEAADADEAAAVLQAVPEVALLFTDVRMPGSVDGLGLVRWAREQRPHVKVIVASADGAGLAAGGNWDAALRKPYDILGMIRCVRALLVPPI